MKIFGLAVSLVSVIVLSQIVPGSSALGGWISGGGKVRKDADNPWFLVNTETIRWCFEKDALAFSAGDDLVRAVVVRGFEYWQRELQNAADLIANDTLPVQTLGTQQLVETACDDHVDVRFIFGKPGPELSDYLRVNSEAPRDYIGLTVRTDYDRINLKGRGFIYVAPDLKSSSHFPVLAKFKEGVWSLDNGIFLQGVINHELGHIFGLSHAEPGFFGQLGEVRLMSEDFPASAAAGYEMVKRDVFPRIVMWKDEFSWYENCELAPETRRYLSLEPDTQCIGAQFGKFPETIRLKVRRAEGPWNEFASFGIYRGRNGLAHQAVSAWMPSQQRVVRDPEGNLLKDRSLPMLGWIFHREHLASGIIPGNGRSVLLEARLEPQCARLTFDFHAPMGTDLQLSLGATGHPAAGKSPCY
jgi:hypothetical protein